MLRVFASLVDLLVSKVALGCFLKLWGVGKAVVEQARLNVGVVICSWSLSPELVRDFEVEGAMDFLIVRGVTRLAAGGTLNLRGRIRVVGFLIPSSLSSSMMITSGRAVPAESSFAGPRVESSPAPEAEPGVEAQLEATPSPIHYFRVRKGPPKKEDKINLLPNSMDVTT
jgi:hypothetical protein